MCSLRENIHEILLFTPIIYSQNSFQIACGKVQRKIHFGIFSQNVFQRKGLKIIKNLKNKENVKKYLT